MEREILENRIVSFTNSVSFTSARAIEWIRMEYLQVIVSILYHICAFSLVNQSGIIQWYLRKSPLHSPCVIPAKAGIHMIFSL